MNVKHRDYVWPIWYSQNPDSFITDRERITLILREGIPGQEPVVLQRMADVFGVTRERVSQYRQRAVEKVRFIIAAQAAGLAHRERD